MKSANGRFRPPRDPVAAYAVLMAPPRYEAALDAARIKDFGHRIDALQRQLKTLHGRNTTSGSAETQSDLSP
jgi:hypothetical protein